MYGNREKGDSVFIFFIKSALENISGAKITRFYIIYIFLYRKKKGKGNRGENRGMVGKEKEMGEKNCPQYFGKFLNLDMGRLSSLIEH